MTSPVSPELIAAVERALDRHGFATTTIEQIAQEAGVNRVTLYRRGLTRERLLTEAALAATREFQAATLPALTHSGTGRDRLDALLTALYDLADRHLALLAGLYDGPTAIFHLTLDSADDATAALTRLEYTQPFERVLHDANTDHSLHSADPHQDAELIFNLAGWTYIHLRRSHRWPPGKARAAITNQVLRSLAPRTQSGSHT